MDGQSVPGPSPGPEVERRHCDTQVGDGVLIKNETAAGVEFQRGQVMEAIPGKDSHIRSIEVEYKNPSEMVLRHTLLPIQKVVVIVPVDYQFKDNKAESLVPEPAAEH